MRRGPSVPEGSRQVVCAGWASARAVARLVALGVAVAVAGCGLMRPRLLDVPPGQRAVLGRVDLSLFTASEVLIQIVRTDGAFQHELYVGRGPQDFAIALPPGRYVVTEVRPIDQRLAFGNSRPRPVRVAFEVGPEPAVYVGTLRLVSALGSGVQFTIADEFATTVPALRARYSDIPAEVARSIFQPV
jgi:hypothetical protein